MVVRPQAQAEPARPHVAPIPHSDPVRGGVAWSAFEIPKAGPRYRAGIEFFDPTCGAGQFIEETLRKEAPIKGAEKKQPKRQRKSKGKNKV